MIGCAGTGASFFGRFEHEFDDKFRPSVVITLCAPSPREPTG
jgi:hypothetical protein